MSDFNLIIQTQRLGDIAMSFPLCTWLNQKNNKAVWIVGEENFYNELFRLSPPNMAYLSLQEQKEILKFNFETVINLSHNVKTYSFADKLKKNEFFGMLKSETEQKIHGNWHLYRNSLIHNNHYNNFHWVDLSALDCIDLETIKNHKWEMNVQRNTGRIGLFVGASEASKRPDANFWAELAISLAKKGYDPIFLAGSNQEEKALCQQCANLASMPNACLAGRFNVFELVTFLKTLDLFITPDTGPMHLAAQNGIPTLNLSMGNVNPWETAAYPPGHYVLRSTISCTNCWQCTKQSNLCKKSFIPNRLANLINCLLQKKNLPSIPSTILYKTGKTAEGLYQLEVIKGNKKYAQIQTDFWRYFFADYFFSLKGKNTFTDKKVECGEIFKQNFNNLHKFLKIHHLKLLKNFITLKNNFLEKDDWKKYPPIIRPLTSFVQRYLENENYSANKKKDILQLLEFFQNHLN